MKTINYLILSTLALSALTAHAQRRPIPPRSSHMIKEYKQLKTKLNQKKLNTKKSQNQKVYGSTSSARAAFEKYFNRSGRADMKDLNQQLKEALEAPVLPAQRENKLEKILFKYKHQITRAYSNTNFKELEYRRLIQSQNPEDDITNEGGGTVSVETPPSNEVPAISDLHFSPPYMATTTNITSDAVISNLLRPVTNARTSGRIQTQIKTGILGNTLAESQVLQEFQMPNAHDTIKLTAQVRVRSFALNTFGGGIANASTGLNVQVFNNSNVVCTTEHTLAEAITVFPISWSNNNGSRVIELTLYCQLIPGTKAVIAVGSFSETLVTGIAGATAQNDSFVNYIDVEFL